MLSLAASVDRTMGEEAKPQEKEGSTYSSAVGRKTSYKNLLLYGELRNVYKIIQILVTQLGYQCMLIDHLHVGYMIYGMLEC